MFNDYVGCTTINALQAALLGAIYNKQTHYEQQLRVSFACTLQAESFLTLYILKRGREQNCNMATYYADTPFHVTNVMMLCPREEHVKRVLLYSSKLFTLKIGNTSSPSNTSATTS